MGTQRIPKLPTSDASKKPKHSVTADPIAEQSQGCFQHETTLGVQSLACIRASRVQKQTVQCTQAWRSALAQLLSKLAAVAGTTALKLAASNRRALRHGKSMDSNEWHDSAGLTRCCSKTGLSCCVGASWQHLHRSSAIHRTIDTRWTKAGQSLNDIPKLSQQRISQIKVC